MISGLCPLLVAMFSSDRQFNSIKLPYLYFVTENSSWQSDRYWVILSIPNLANMQGHVLHALMTYGISPFVLNILSLVIIFPCKCNVCVGITNTCWNSFHKETFFHMQPSIWNSELGLFQTQKNFSAGSRRLKNLSNGWIWTFQLWSREFWAVFWVVDKS